MNQSKLEETANKLQEEVSVKSKRMKIRTLMKHFDYDRRTEESATQITELLSTRDIIIQPSIMKMGEDWQLKLDDQVRLSLRKNEIIPCESDTDIAPIDPKRDLWFDELENKNEYIRNEKEVESKFIVPLLGFLGYTDLDRFDGMSLEGAHGSTKTKLIVDSALFDSENKNEDFRKHVLLLVEAKFINKHEKKKKPSTPTQLDDAKNQVKSYGVFATCFFALVTNWEIVQVLELFPRKLPKIGGNNDNVIFECKRDELKIKFGELYSCISKKSLVKYYGI